MPLSGCFMNATFIVTVSCYDHVTVTVTITVMVTVMVTITFTCTVTITVMVTVKEAFNA